MSKTVLGYASKSFHDRAVSDYRSGQDGDDEADVGTAVTGASVLDLNGRANIAVAVEFSVSGATCDVTVLLHNDDGDAYAVADTITATAGRFTISSKYMAPLLLFDAAGAQGYSVRIDDPSSGTVDLRTWSY